MVPRGLLQEHASVLSLIARLVDVACVLSGAYIAYLWRLPGISFSTEYIIALILSGLLTFLVFPLSGVYDSLRGKSWFSHVRKIALSWLAVVVILIVIAFLTKTGAEFSRKWMTMWSFSTLGLLLLFRFALFALLVRMRIKGWNHRKILIIGTDELAINVAKSLKEAVWAGLDIVAFVDDTGDGKERTIENLPVINGIDKLEALISEKNIDDVWLALPLHAEKRMKTVLEMLRHSTVNVRFVPGIFGFRLLNHSVTEIAGLPVIDLSATPMVGMNRVIKALEDRLLALAILIIVIPFMLLIALGVKLSSAGPIMFKQRRLGWDGKSINVYKFRTMYVHDESKNTVTQATQGDARITKFGAFLRRTSLDELPQFLNVLQGKMSIVGPRPHALAHNEYYKESVDAYMLRHKVKPGITGWAQINGFRGETDTLEKMQRRVEYDLFYIENWSLWLDIKIIIRTIFSGFTSKNAY